MEKNILFSTIKEIQNEYLVFLKKIKNSADEDFYLIVDSLKSFWFLKKNIIETFLNHYSNKFDTCAFLCGSYINTSNFSHLPFCGLGNKHVIDDVVVKFSMVALKGPSKEIVKTAANSLKKAINDNINCLEQYPEIIILPISFLYDDMDMVRHGSDSAFFSLFNTEDLSLEKYLAQYRTLEDVFNDLKDYTKEQLYLDNHLNLQLEERYSVYLSETGFSKPSENEVFNFYAVTSSLYAQALSIISLCVRFKFYPYIREKIIFHNFMLLIDNFTDYLPPQIELYALIHFIFLDMIDYEYHNYQETVNDIEIIKKNNLLGKIINQVEKQNIKISSSGSFNKIKNIICDELMFIGISYSK